MSRAWWWIQVRAFPVVWATAFLAVVTTSTVGRRGTSAGLDVLAPIMPAVVLVYAALLYLLAIRPDLTWWHRPGAALAVIVATSRAAPFAALLAGGHHDLLGALVERCAIGVTLLGWHLGGHLHMEVPRLASPPTPHD